MLRQQLGDQKYQEFLDSAGGEDQVWETWVNLSQNLSSNSTGFEKVPSRVVVTPREQSNPFADALPIAMSVALTGMGYAIYAVALFIGRTLLWLASFGTLNYQTREWGDEKFEPGTGCTVTAVILGIVINAIAFGPTWILLAIAVYILAFIYFLISNYVKEHGWGWLLKTAVVAGCLTGGYLIWLVGPWMIDSVRLWWNWLGTHF
jgi:hypothetical protein